MRHQHEQGATALVIVLFSVLLLVTVTVSFMRIMVNESSRTNDTELSQGAYDSALAGVEDGKRVLTACDNGDTQACDAIASSKCNTISAAGLATASGNGEVYLKTSTSDTAGISFQQAYTCLKIARTTKTYDGAELRPMESAVVPLSTTGGFTQMLFRWRIPNGGVASLSTDLIDTSLPVANSWGLSTPALLRVQLIQYASGSPIDQTSFDNNQNGHTLYLYPKKGSIASSYDFALDGRRSGVLTPKIVSCSLLPTFQGYNCEATLTLPDPQGGTSSNRSAYLRVTSLYNSSEYQIVPLGTEFNNVQPAIDSTGRAADVFRRIVARVEHIDPTAAALYPRATIETTGNLCKTMVIGTQASYYDPGSCTP